MADVPFFANVDLRLIQYKVSVQVLIKQGDDKFAPRKKYSNKLLNSLGLIQDFREGGLRYGPVKVVPCRGVGGVGTCVSYAKRVVLMLLS